MVTLREQLIKKQAEALLQKMGVSASIYLPTEEINAVTGNKNEAQQVCHDAQDVLTSGEQFFRQFGLSDDRQEELFTLPIIRQCQDEIEHAVYQERSELERAIGKPKNGWMLLPFERHRVSQPKLLHHDKPEQKITEVRALSLGEKSAKERISAIQKKLSDTLETVRENVKRQKEEFTLPQLLRAPSVEKKIEISFPEYHEKQKINAEVMPHYAEQLRVIEEEPCEKEPLLTNLVNQIGETADSEKLTLVEANKEKINTVIPEETLEVIPEIVSEKEKQFSNVASRMPQHNVILSALRSQQQNSMQSNLAEQILANHHHMDENHTTEPSTSLPLRRSYGRRITL